MEKILKYGSGWRLGWNPKAVIYKGLIGGDDWAIELTESEWQDLRRLLSQLTATMAAMATELMDEERIACEAESELLWVEADGFPDNYSLRFILYQGRGCEGNWSATALPELLAAWDNLLYNF
ncbi:MAG: DUF1818 family protein [Microcystis aeruginosa Ma_QC_Ch_20071001_S25]|jgi:hypothetical protein|uniref:DUF1818 family protein n=1 Tax=Microcystis aeruginosa Ma_QC_Ch_20071001_S25D TaxID=2486250 RepID=A0A552FFP8_MICAE|nr:MAG: DUF1818 family protein [Microcystis aeruginosa Ma_QC_Ch_20071001_S25D]TRU52338.1 MAG: DUF1818 family protein [Microcystis aeruginosa Ma_QC_Ch_20071001_S25]TRU66650.1 MAG: DUF1818 family protein [Microcystis aeruginosa Ma_QC_Ch_20071001_M135]